MSGNIEEPEEQLSTLEEVLVNSGFDVGVAKRIVLLCSDYAEKKFNKWRNNRINTEKAKSKELYEMCKKFEKTGDFNILEDIEKKLLEMCTQK